MSDISGREFSYKVQYHRKSYDYTNTDALSVSFFVLFLSLPLHPPSRCLSNSFFFFFFFSYDPVKDDSAENGMPLAFLISAFCRLLSTNGTRPRYHRADSAARSTLRGIFARKIYISGRRTVSRWFFDFCGCPLSLSLSLVRQELFGAET